MNQKKMSTERTEGNKFSRSKIVFCVIYAAILLEAVLMGKIQGLDFTQNLVNIVTAVIYFFARNETAANAIIL